MKKVQIVLDRPTEAILASLAESHSGDKSRAVREILRMHETLDTLLDELEAGHGPELRLQKARSEKGFREGKSTTWEEVKRKARL
jgi:hypothetical protein